MNITVGFVHNSRDLTLTCDEAQEAVLERITTALESPDSTLRLTDAKGNVYVLRTSAIAYVEVGASRTFPVGFTH